MMNALRKYLMDSRGVASRLFSSTIGETATNKGYSFGFNYITYELKLIGIIGLAMYVFSKFEINSLKDAMKESEARTSNNINHIKVDMKSEMKEIKGDMKSEMKEIKGDMKREMKEIKVDMKREMKEIKGDMKSEMKELEARMRNEITFSEERIKSDVKASELRIFQKINDAFAGKNLSLRISA